MERAGPALERLTQRLAETPADFLAEPRIGSTGTVHVAAVAADLLALLGGNVPASELAAFNSNDARRDRNRLVISLIVCWLLSDDWFRQMQPDPVQVLQILRDSARELAAQNVAAKFIHDPDRREELARLALAALGCRPAGETVAQAQDRLTSLSSVERARVMRASRMAEERARAIRAALAKKAAEESADKWTRE